MSSAATCLISCGSDCASSACGGSTGSASTCRSHTRGRGSSVPRSRRSDSFSPESSRSWPTTTSFDCSTSTRWRPTWTRPSWPRISAGSCSTMSWARCAGERAKPDRDRSLPASTRRLGRRLAQAPREITPRLEPRVGLELALRSLPFPALLERQPEAVVRLGQGWIAGERRALLAQRVLDAPGVEVDEAQVAPDPRTVGIESDGRFELRDGLRQLAFPVALEPSPPELRRLGALDRGLHGSGDLGFAPRVPRSAIGVDEKRIDGQEAGVPGQRPLERADRVGRAAGRDQRGAETVERERVLLEHNGIFVRENDARKVAFLLPRQRLALQDVEPA